MCENKVARIDLDQIVAEKFLKKKLPKVVMYFLKKIAHQDDLNELFASAPGKKNLDFIDVCMKYFNITCNVVGLENLPQDGRRLIFVCNHPQGALEAICIAKVLGYKYDGKLKFYANEFLTLIEPLKEMFLPIYKHRNQSRENIQMIKDFYKSDNHLVLFPAGITAQKCGNKIMDSEWNKGFVKAAIVNQRDVVPLYFQAQNSDLFYRIENFRRFIHSKINFEIALFVDEIFKQKGNTFTLYIGNSICFETFNDTKSHKEWAAWLRGIVSKLPTLG